MAADDGVTEAWSRWWSRVVDVHKLMESTEPIAQSVEKINGVFEDEGQARSRYADALKQAGRPVPDYLARSATLVPLWPAAPQPSPTPGGEPDR
jgi:hypothetical protein